MRYLLVLSILFCGSAAAQTPENMLESMYLGLQTGCQVDTEPGVNGFCELYFDAEGMAWLVFYDQPGRIKFIRTGEEGTEYHYLYRADALDIPV